MKIDSKYFPAISRIFTPLVMNELAYQGYSGYLKEVFENSGLFKNTDLSMPLSHFFDWIYSFLSKNYKNEYIYKNAIANKILLGRYSLNTSHMLTEFRVGNCKADVVLINGTSTVYEVKSEYDSFTRLEKQIETYFQIFDHINVITTVSQASKLKSILPNAVGILILTNRNSISVVKDSVSNKHNIKPDILFDSLRKSEYLKIIKEIFGKVPIIPNTQIYKECKKIFCSISPESAHDLTFTMLRDRKNTQVLNKFINIGPSSLVAYALSIGTDRFKMLSLIPKFNKSLASALIPKIA